VSALESAAPLAAAVAGGRLTARDAAERSLAAIAERDPDLGAFLVVAGARARDEADAVDAAVRAGRAPGILAGVPVAVKDNLCVRDLPTTAGSRILDGFRPLYDATVVTRLRAAGAVLVGKTNLDEFAMGSSNENIAFRVARNPHDAARVPGGSSGGSAAAVAAGLVPLALGSDTGGSVRQPAAFCGVYGLKPTYGRVSRYGLIAFASSLDQVGGFARDLEGLALLYRAIAGEDPLDATSAARAVDPVDAAAGARGLRVGVAAGLLDRPGVDPAIAARLRERAAALEAAGCVLSTVELPDPDLAVAAYYLLATAEASSNLARYDGVRFGARLPGDTVGAMMRRTRTAGFGPEVKRRILLGTYVLSAGYRDATYLKAQEARRVLARRFGELFAAVDLLLLPTTPTTAFRIGEKRDDPVAMYLSDVFTVYANLIGAPALSVPAGTDAQGLPIGLQLLAPSWREDLLFRAAGPLERAA
jgi:aspartyl-tRNA(Asn)/glutamyl-tRNA(Gln) amidotransferase subunit A